LILIRRKTLEEPERYKWHYLLAQLAFDEQRYSEALSHSSKAMSLRPNSVEPYILNTKVRIYLPAGSTQITKCENLKSLSEQLSKLPALPSNEIEIELLKFKCKLECEEYEKAEEIITKLEESHPMQMEIETAFVDLLMAKKQNEEAEDKLFALIDLYPQKITPVLYLANIMINTDKNKECENVILAAIDKIEEIQFKRKLTIMLANIYYENNEKEKERLFLTRMLKKIPDDIPIRKVLAELYIDDKQYSKTQTIIDEIKEIEGVNGLQ
jgi:predicted Zn-dependent protease